MVPRYRPASSRRQMSGCRLSASTRIVWPCDFEIDQRSHSSDQISRVSNLHAAFLQLLGLPQSTPDLQLGLLKLKAPHRIIVVPSPGPTHQSAWLHELAAARTAAAAARRLPAVPAHANGASAGCQNYVGAPVGCGGTGGTESIDGGSMHTHQYLAQHQDGGSGAPGGPAAICQPSSLPSAAAHVPCAQHQLQPWQYQAGQPTHAGQGLGSGYGNAWGTGGVIPGHSAQLLSPCVQSQHQQQTSISAAGSHHPWQRIPGQQAYPLQTCGLQPAQQPTPWPTTTAPTAASLAGSLPPPPIPPWPPGAGAPATPATPATSVGSGPTLPPGHRHRTTLSLLQEGLDASYHCILREVDEDPVDVDDAQAFQDRIRLRVNAYAGW